MQRKHGAGDAGVSPLEGAVFESWFEGGTPSSSRPQGWGSPGQWPHNQETRAGYWEPSKAAVRRRQLPINPGGAGGGAGELQLRPRRQIIISEMIKQ